LATANSIVFMCQTARASLAHLFFDENSRSIDDDTHFTK